MGILLNDPLQGQSVHTFPVNPLSMETYKSNGVKKKVVVIMGATGTGKSKLSISLAVRFNAEIINSDKMQVYKGLNIVTNKITEEERRGIPHHLLGVIQPDDDFTPADFRYRATEAIESILSRGKLPIIVGGSNTYIEALIGEKEGKFLSKYDCCFLWVDVESKVLHDFVSIRVNQMEEAGLLDEVRDMFDEKADYRRGIRRAIGVPEMDKYLRAEAVGDDKYILEKLLREAISEIKENTCDLADRQLKKILRLRQSWDLNRIDATEVFKKKGSEAERTWEEKVAKISTFIVKKFLPKSYKINLKATPTTTITSIPTVAAAVTW